MKQKNKTGKRIALLIVVSLISIVGNAQSARNSVSLAGELKTLYDVAALPQYRTGTKMFQVSSYDTTGGNDDGFSGKYSFIRKDPNGHLVLFDTKGSGVINRIWTPTPTHDTLDFYLDDTTRPAFSIPFIDLFSGKVFPFVFPLCGNELGGYYCYLPIPFQQHCKIVSRGKKVEFYQIQCRLYPPKTPVKTFQMQLDPGEKAALQKVTAFWEKQEKNISDFTEGSGSKILTKSKTIVINPGETQKTLELNKGGRIVGIEITPAENFAGLHKQLDLQIRWDDEPVAAVDCPVADFFGYAFGQPSMQSLLLGSRNNKDYCYFPMPFDQKATIALHYRENAAASGHAVQVHATIYYTTQKRKDKTEGRFYAWWNSKKEYQSGNPHVFLNTNGKGHYVGTILQAQGLNPGMTLFFEGDDSTALDGQFRMHGTGSEDYFNGGWYALVDRWDGAMSLPLHGALTYSLPLARTGGYRLFLSDKIPFEKSFYQSIEHGPTDNVPAYYTSVALYYGNKPPLQVVKPENAITDIFIPDTLMMYPQLMQFTIGGQVDFKFEGPLVLTGDNGSLVRVNLDDIPPGKYKLYMDLNKNKNGAAFSVWQRQTQLADEISTYETDRKHVPQQYLCDIRVEKLKNTVTLKFHTDGDRKSLSLNRLIFIRTSEE